MSDTRVSASGDYSVPTGGDGARRILYRGAAGAFAVQAGGAALGLGVHAILARLLGRPEYGIYALALTWVNVLSVIALLGQGSSVVRFVARYAYHGQWSELRGLRRGTSAMVLGASAGISICGAAIVRLSHARFGTDLELTFYAAFLLLPVLTQLQLSGALHRGLKRAASSGAFNQLLRPVVILALVAILVFGLGRALTAPDAMIASTLGALSSLGLSEWFLGRVWPGEAKAPPRYQARTWFTLGRQLFFLDVIGIVLARVDVLILGAFAGASEVGPYYAAVQLATVASADDRRTLRRRR
jgi:O-antigen/teichoic acid export membrane protein